MTEPEEGGEGEQDPSTAHLPRFGPGSRWKDGRRARSPQPSPQPQPQPQAPSGLTAVCGRYAAAIPAMDLAASFGIRPEHVQAPDPSYNVAPTDPVPAVLARIGPSGEIRTEMRVLHWGLVPWWATDSRGAAKRINARVETVAERPAYRSALASRRCVLPANGYYEWRAGASGQPYFLHPPDGLLPIAGLYERWRSPGGELRETCTMLTTAATGPLAALHDRTPMVVPPACWSSWLDPREADRAAVLQLPVAATGGLDAHPVHPRVGNVREAGAHLIERVVARPPV